MSAPCNKNNKNNNDVKNILEQTQCYQQQLIDALVERKLNERLQCLNEQKQEYKVDTAQQRLTQLQNDIVVHEERLKELQNDIAKHDRLSQNTLRSCDDIITKINRLADHWIGSGCDSYYHIAITEETSKLTAVLRENK
jgi:tRNA U34 5-carboxymethylaminomethyl modifying enzyme MnmG/GidA